MGHNFVTTPLKKKEEKTAITEFIKNMKDASRDNIFI
jgi:hypothetical protein